MLQLIHASRIHNENVTLPNMAAAQGDFATTSLRTAESKPRVGLR
eukprot:COSAG03_NODE_26105_length_261_cov_0.944444_1_plen_44_part_10